MNTSLLANKLKMTGHTIAGYNDFGVVEQKNLGYILYIERRGKVVAFGTEKPYIWCNILEHFIIMREPRIRQSLFIKGKGYDILRRYKISSLWGEPDNRAMLPNATWLPITGADEVIQADEVIGVTDGNGMRRLINYSGKSLQIGTNESTSVNRIIKENDMYIVTTFTPTRYQTIKTIDIGVDKELNILL